MISFLYNFRDNGVVIGDNKDEEDAKITSIALKKESNASNSLNVDDIPMTRARGKSEMRKLWPRFNVESSLQTHYDLFGAVQHYGRAGGGHYIAHCLCTDVNKKEVDNDGNGDEQKVKEKWYLFDDHRVSCISPMNIKSKHAYILFYIRSDLHQLFTQQMRDQFVDSVKKSAQDVAFDMSSINIDEHFQFLPEDVREQIGKKLTESQKRLLESEGVERGARTCVIL